MNSPISSKDATRERTSRYLLGNGGGMKEVLMNECPMGAQKFISRGCQLKPVAIAIARARRLAFPG